MFQYLSVLCETLHVFRLALFDLSMPVIYVVFIMSPPEGLGDILFFPGRPDVRLSVRLSVTNRVRSVT